MSERRWRGGGGLFDVGPRNSAASGGRFYERCVRAGNHLLNASTLACGGYRRVSQQSSEDTRRRLRRRRGRPEITSPLASETPCISRTAHTRRTYPPTVAIQYVCANEPLLCTCLRNVCTGGPYPLRRARPALRLYMPTVNSSYARTNRETTKSADHRPSERLSVRMAYLLPRLAMMRETLEG